MCVYKMQLKSIVRGTCGWKTMSNAGLYVKSVCKTGHVSPGVSNPSLGGPLS